LLQVDKEREAESSVLALQHRVDRLSSELEEAAIQVEVLTAKGRMYDDLQAKAEQLVGREQGGAGQEVMFVHFGLAESIQ
jgi:hypothetical protein